MTTPGQGLAVSPEARPGEIEAQNVPSLPGPDARCVLHPRVQSGAFVITLARRASERYRILGDAVTSALKLTKVFGGRLEGGRITTLRQTRITSS